MTARKATAGVARIHGRVSSVRNAAVAERPVVVQPGIYGPDVMPEGLYHSDPVPGGSLSCSSARKLLPPSCPKRFRYEADHPKPPTESMERGTAAHKLLLGSGAELEVVDATDWRTKKAQQQAKEARARGAVPMLRDAHRQTQDMVAALRDHPFAGMLFDPERGGRPEQSLFWQDGETGIMRRARVDWLPTSLTIRDRLVVPDYKSIRRADLDTIEKHIHEYGYHAQGDWYSAGVETLGLGEKVAFTFVFQEPEPPYLVTVVELDSVARQIGRERNRQAIGTYHQCMSTGTWPGYSDDAIIYASVPAWVRRQTFGGAL